MAGGQVLAQAAVSMPSPSILGKYKHIAVNPEAEKHE
jgi:hypothetical protein